MKNMIVSQNDLFAAFKSIQAAIRVAELGAKIFIDPGIYQESIILDRDIELVGNGAPEDIIVQSHEVSCISIDTIAVKVSSITFQGLGEANQYGLVIHNSELILRTGIFSSTGESVFLEAENRISVFEKSLFHNSKWGELHQ
ncbi:hypothetical protein [Neobacillus vireti]|uniref:hypothetical protein n=1 Tax=Neobacillus vireti TaxID=220686 RepID=UPI0030001524